MTLACEIDAPLRSVTRPASVAVDCAWVKTEKTKTEGAKKLKRKNCRTQSLIVSSVSLSRGSVKAVPKAGSCQQPNRATALTFEIETPPVSWLGGALLARPSRTDGRVFRRSARRSDARPIFPPYSRAAAAAFHRLPVHGVSW